MQRGRIREFTPTGVVKSSRPSSNRAEVPLMLARQRLVGRRACLAVDATRRNGSCEWPA
jgi:hypothetical protein